MPGRLGLGAVDTLIAAKNVKLRIIGIGHPRIELLQPEQRAAQQQLIVGQLPFAAQLIGACLFRSQIEIGLRQGAPAGDQRADAFRRGIERGARRRVNAAARAR